VWRIDQTGLQHKKGAPLVQPLTVNVENFLLLAVKRPTLPLITTLDEKPEEFVRWGVSRKYLRQVMKAWSGVCRCHSMASM
jgi:hypothetical protein